MKKTVSMLSFTLCLATGVSCFAQTVQTTATAQEMQAAEELKAQNNYALPWKTIEEKDIAWQKRVWRNIDVKDPKNKAFIHDMTVMKDKDLARIMIKGFMDGEYKVYSAENDRFSKELTKDELNALLEPGTGNAGFNQDVVTGFRIKEDWLFLKSAKKIVVRIVGIAPLMELTDEKGIKTTAPAFWIYYPDARKYFAAHKTDSDNENWDMLFESRNFGSQIENVIDVKADAQEQ